MSFYSKAINKVLAPVLGLTMLAGVGCGNPHNDFDGPVDRNVVEYNQMCLGLWKKVQVSYEDTGDTVSYGYVPFSRNVWRVVVESDTNRAVFTDLSLNGVTQDIMDDAELESNTYLDKIVQVQTRNF